MGKYFRVTAGPTWLAPGACAGGLRFFPGIFSDTLTNRKYRGARNLKFRFCKVPIYVHIFVRLFSILGVRWRAIARLKRQALKFQLILPSIVEALQEFHSNFIDFSVWNAQRILWTFL
jgi:hypothetical protein